MIRSKSTEKACDLAKRAPVTAHIMNVQRQMLTNFIDLYRENKCLWDPNHEHYRDKFHRTQALEALLEIYKAYDPEANIDSVRNKINSLRSNYNKERKKALIRPNYRNTLWYHEKLSFLDAVLASDPQMQLDEESQQRVSTSKKRSQTYQYNSDSDNPARDTKRSRKYEHTKSDNNIKFEIDQFDSDSSTNGNDVSYTDEAGGELRKNNQSTEQVYIFDQEHGGQGNSSRVTNTHYHDEFDSFANTVAISLRKLEDTQQAIAQKLISDVIFYSKLNKLTENTTISFS